LVLKRRISRCSLFPYTTLFRSAAVGRYHFLSLGRFVPYVELAGAAGGTTLRVREIDSAFTFLIFGGVGASYFLTDRIAPYVGYRDRKRTRLNSSNGSLSYVVFC